MRQQVHGVIAQMESEPAELADAVMLEPDPAEVVGAVTRCGTRRMRRSR
ncbi:hypothetical protein [Nocardia sp. R6R-6]